MKLLIAGGGTGGHLFPGIAVAEEFLARDSRNEVLFVGTERGIESRVLPKLGYRLECISAAGIRGKAGISQAKGMAMLLYGYAQSRKILRAFQPDLVLGVGGYASGPVVLAARGLQIKRFVHEQNALPGFTNKVLGRFAEKVFISMEETRAFFTEGKSVLTGNPVRREILAQFDAAGAGERTGSGFNLLVFGGSQGAHRINTTLLEALPHLRELQGKLAITHQTGENDLSTVREGYAAAGFEATVVPFIDNMAQAYHGADLIVCRAGATTIAEVTACGKACIFIPFPFAVDDHQRKNAEALLKKGAGFVIIEQELSGEVLGRQILELFNDREMLAETGRSAAGMARRDAAKIIVDEMTG